MPEEVVGGVVAMVWLMRRWSMVKMTNLIIVVEG